MRRWKRGAALMAAFLLAAANSCVRPGRISAQAAPPSGAEAEHGESKTTESREGEQPFLIQITEEDPSAAYVLISAPDPIGLLPLPPAGEYSRAIRQKQPDGSEWVNVLHLTPDGFRMEESNCPGHDCIEEGTVTLENRDERILGNAVICLPHLLLAELLTREEAERLFP